MRNVILQQVYYDLLKFGCIVSSCKTRADCCVVRLATMYSSYVEGEVAAYYHGYTCYPRMTLKHGPKYWDNK